MEQHQKQTRDEKIKELTEKLEEGIKSVFASSKYREYLTVMSKFHSYSFNNSILILMQSRSLTQRPGSQSLTQTESR